MLPDGYVICLEHNHTPGEYGCRDPYGAGGEARNTNDAELIARIESHYNNPWQEMFDEMEVGRGRDSH